MKKKYSKPGIIIEDFATSQNIAGTCGNKNGPDRKFTYADKYSCGWNTGTSEGIVFTSTKNCTSIIPDDEIYEEECYNNPGGMYTIFNS